VKDGHRCAPNELIAYCQLNLRRSGGKNVKLGDLDGDERTQVGLAARVGGRIHIRENVALGGYLNILEAEAWDPNCEICDLEPDADTHIGAVADAGRLRQILLSGRRVTEIAGAHSGLLPGWLGRSRGWWSEGGETPITLLSLGICDALALVLGEHNAFLELFAQIPQATHVVLHPDHPITPAAPVLLDQLNRTPEAFAAIAKDLHDYLSRSTIAPSAHDFIFAGSLLSAMQKNPIMDSYNVILGTGVQRLHSAQAILLSVNAEPLGILRHRTLGFHLYIMPHHLAAAGPAIQAWLSSEFDVVLRTVLDIQKDYEALIDQVSAKTGAKLIVINRMSTSGREDVSDYSPFDKPLMNTLANVGAKEFNLMLHDIAEEREIFILDIDAIAAEVGGARNIPDGIHYGSEIQARLQDDLAAILDALRPVHP